MEEKHRRAIQANFSSLVEQTDLDAMVSYLYEKGVFSEAMIEPYKDTATEVRTRKRQLYRDIERRGPKAFELLLETLTELGYWDLVRSLQPDSALHKRRVVEQGNNCKSLKYEKKKVQEQQQQQQKQREDVTPFVIPKFNVIKSQQFAGEQKDGFGLYKTRSAKRGVVLVFTFITFKNNTDTYRSGAHIDTINLKYLFSEIGMKVLSYDDLTRQEFENTIKQPIAQLDTEVECVFVIVSSHGYENTRMNDTDIRCSDGKLISCRQIIEFFNNNNCPRLNGKPKVFIFQTCRGNSRSTSLNSTYEPVRRQLESDGSVMPFRVYSDMLIANSTLPGYVSLRDVNDGSWYIQSLCEVFAARAHDCHVEDLFKLVDKNMAERLGSQTSSIDNWGFNKRLYLHPGLVERQKNPESN